MCFCMRAPWPAHPAHAMYFPSVGRSLIFLWVIFSPVCAVGEYQKSVDALQIIKANGEVLNYQVELADTEVLRSRGLMYRRMLAPAHGMLLAYPQARRVSIWMKNTYIPLDIIYINSLGEITQINTDAIPHDRTSLRSQLPVLAVLELHAGETRKQNIRVGDKVVHPVFDP